MKVAITCDFLLERNHYSEIIEMMCELYPEAKIYCFAHKQGAILGHIEQRSIASTFLSHKVSTEDEFYKHSFQIPSLAKNLFVSCEYDLILNISKGFSQGIKKCDRTKLITYLYDLNYKSKINQTFLQKIFHSFVESWIKKSLKKSDLVLVSRPDIQAEVLSFLPEAELLLPPFRLSDYSLFPKEMFKHHFFAIEANNLSPSDAERLSEWMKEWGEAFQFVGNDDHLKSLKSKLSSKSFFGNRCSGEHAPQLASSRALISINQSGFPQLPMATLATGRPIITLSSFEKWAIGSGIYQIDKLDKVLLKNAIDKLNLEHEQLEGQKIRANVMNYHDIKFKSQLRRTLEQVISNQHQADSNQHQHSNNDESHCDGCGS